MTFPSAQASAQAPTPASAQLPALVPGQGATHVPDRAPWRAGLDRSLILGLLGGLMALCWGVLLLLAGHAPAAGAGVHAADGAPWQAADLALLIALWVGAIAALMLPAAAPSVLLYARIKRLRRERWVYLSTLLFTLGCLCVWCCCALAATLAGWALHDAGALDESMAVAHPTVGALALVAAGLYQWTPAKHACLEHCRAPLAFMRTGWRRGVPGAFRMGVADARYGSGCCWLLMALLLPAGVLNLPAVGGLLALILAERLLPGGGALACAAGLGLVAWGTALLFP
jgi:predicted metal-binding membrane protein